MGEPQTDFKDLIGRQTVHTYEVTARDIRRFAQAIGDDNPLYYDEEYAKKTKYGGIIAPPLFCHTCAFDDLPAEKLRSDGLPDELNLPLPTTKAVGGGSVFEVGEPVRPGDTITVTKVIEDIYLKQGKSGALYFTVLTTTYTNQKGQFIAREKASFIQR
ncbi:MAG: FAS1-like dehydratase domain-containing protein [Bacillota bacterium]